MTKRKIIRVSEDIDSDNFSGPLKTIRQNVDLLIEKYSDFLDAEIELTGDQMYCGVDCSVHYSRFETDKEFEQRLKKEEKQRNQKKMQKVKKEDAERKELARLLKKYPDEVE